MREILMRNWRKNCLDLKKTRNSYWEN